MELPFPLAMRLNRMDAPAACCHFSTFIGSFLSQRETSLWKRSNYKSTRGKGWHQRLAREMEAPSDGILRMHNLF